jgi:hypothetical protein
MSDAIPLPIFNTYARSAAISAMGLRLMEETLQATLPPPAGTMMQVGAVAMGRLEQHTGMPFEALVAQLQTDQLSKNPYRFGAQMGARIANAMLTDPVDRDPDEELPFDVPRVFPVVSSTPYFEVTG